MAVAEDFYKTVEPVHSGNLEVRLAENQDK